ncbi:hypothetical protein K469DRAFT_700078 [Zopfia rhizophila CBS 207.26]|uniref:Uncharacterized protein n=1 Tax=Zopfia rhizophila CBS 207.26 TaxID=1314779 RepID=A0A6A6D9Z4_9PEZI|nr:hypothetical protein K469DRAFT_700078 [Zopfia rhizophila CBS 207.26]
MTDQAATRTFRRSLRRTLQKWKDELKKDKKPKPQPASTQLLNPFPPTTTTTITSPATPNHPQLPTSASNPKPPKSRRNTAPADYFTTSKSRFRLSKRSSVLPSSTQPLSPIPSAPLPHDHPNRSATFTFTTAPEIAAQTNHESERVVEAAAVIRRDKPKDWLNPNWRAEDAKTRQEAGEMLRASSVNSGKDGTEKGPLRRWERGR